MGYSPFGLLQKRVGTMFRSRNYMCVEFMANSDLLQCQEQGSLAGKKRRT